MLSEIIFVQEKEFLFLFFREREGKREDRSKIVETVRQRPSVARRQGGRKTSGGRGPLLERRKKAALFPSSGAATL